MEQVLREPLTAQTNDFGALYEDSWSAVFRYCLALVREPDEAKDVASETFSRALAAWQRGKVPAEPLPWLFLVARRLVIDAARRKRLLHLLHLDHAEQVSAGANFERSELWLWFKQICDVLPDREREALLLRYEFDLSDQTIGKLMGITQGAVRTLVSRGLARLRSNPEVLK